MSGAHPPWSACAARPRRCAHASRCMARRCPDRSAAPLQWHSTTHSRNIRGMAISVFDLFKIGIGPSSSHTVGPMRAARMFADALHRDRLLARVHSIRIELFGSLGATGKGHGSGKAVMLGLEGEAPELIDPATIPDRIAAIRSRKALRLLGGQRVDFN